MRDFSTRDVLLVTERTSRVKLLLEYVGEEVAEDEGGDQVLRAGVVVQGGDLLLPAPQAVGPRQTPRANLDFQKPSN